MVLLLIAFGTVGLSHLGLCRIYFRISNVKFEANSFIFFTRAFSFASKFYGDDIKSQHWIGIGLSFEIFEYNPTKYGGMVLGASKIGNIFNGNDIIWNWEQLK